MLTDGKSPSRRIVERSSSMLTDGKTSSRRTVEYELVHLD